MSNIQMAPWIAAKNIGNYLRERTGGLATVWSGYMAEVEQRVVFGRFLGQGTIVIDGQRELIFSRAAVAVGSEFVGEVGVYRWGGL